MTDTAKKQPLMMGGTASKNSYLVVARRGGFVLGVKPELICQGPSIADKPTTWFGARLRSAMAGDVFKDTPGKNVISIADLALTTATAWPEVVWENSNEERSSTTLGVFLKGSPSGSDEDVQRFLNEVGEDKLASKMADYVASLAGEEHLTIPVSEIKDWLAEYYRKVVDQIVKDLAKKKALIGELESSVGVFGMQAQILKNALAKAQASSHDNGAEDKDAGEV